MGNTVLLIPSDRAAAASAIKRTADAVLTLRATAIALSARLMGSADAARLLDRSVATIARSTGSALDMRELARAVANNRMKPAPV